MSINSITLEEGLAIVKVLILLNKLAVISDEENYILRVHIFLAQPMQYT